MQKAPPHPRPALRSTFYTYTATSPPATYTLSLHDALPISVAETEVSGGHFQGIAGEYISGPGAGQPRHDDGINSPAPIDGHFSANRSEEHTSELQSRPHLVCRLLLEKKNTGNQTTIYAKGTTTPATRPPLHILYLHGDLTTRDLHSFPTRRSSDLRGRDRSVRRAFSGDCR